MNQKHEVYRQENLKGRYVTLSALRSNWISQNQNLWPTVFGKSEENRDLISFRFGTGEKRVLLWSQMHGNESTTTKAVVDLMNLLTSEDAFARTIGTTCTVLLIPILNPDGAKAYTRFNANGVDLNRDAQELSQLESRALRGIFIDFKPDFCFNLHDQRTMYNVDGTTKSATVSFLAPSYNAERTINSTRKTAMQLIVAMNEVLQQNIPGSVGRYDDTFNENCVGDAFQMSGVPTILFEAGHHPGDYQREVTRKHIFNALLAALEAISNESYKHKNTDTYAAIPENDNLFFDVLIKNYDAIDLSLSGSHSVGIRYEEVLTDYKINFIPTIEAQGNLDSNLGHTIFDCRVEADLSLLKADTALWQCLRLG